MATFAVLVGLFTVGCSDGNMMPPVIQDGDGGLPNSDGATNIAPCSEPAKGCPCSDAGAGAQVYCGVIYRISGKHVDCSPGYLTCQEDGTWSACEGAEIYDGG